MILDTHDRLHRYAGIFRHVDPQPLFEWLNTCRDIPPGQKVDFAGDKLFVKTLRLNTGRCEDLKWEAHREYIDLQYIVGGGEVIEWAPTAKLTAEVAYDEKTDCQFYAPTAADVLLNMQDGLFTILFPADGHKPLVADGLNHHVHKVVAKIHKSLVVI
jgi:YhcH/YjgK/YiaL family protein